MVLPCSAGGERTLRISFLLLREQPHFREHDGAITAALYLDEFVEGEKGDDDSKPPPWLHLDMMAFNTGAKPGRPEGGEAMGVRALYRLIESKYPK